MVECALDDAICVVEEVLKVVHSRFGKDGEREVDENTLFAEAEEKLNGGHNKKEVIKILTSAFINKIRNKSNCSSSHYNSNSNLSHLPAPISLSAVNESIATAVSEQNKKMHIQQDSGATISNHIQNMVSKKLDQSVITKNSNKKSNENYMKSPKSTKIHKVLKEKVKNQEPSIFIHKYSNNNDTPTKSSISAHIHKVVQEKVRNQKPSNAIQTASNESVMNSIIKEKNKNPRKSSISDHIHKVVQEKVRNHEPSSYNSIHKSSKQSASDQIRNDQLRFLDIQRKNNQSNQRINEALQVTTISIVNRELPVIIDITETESTKLKKNQHIRSPELDTSIEVVSILQSENKNSSELDKSIEVVSTLKSQSTIKLNQHCLIENMDDDQFINLICRLFSHVEREGFTKMVRKFNKSYNKVLIMQKFISKGEEEGLKVPEEAYRYLSRINSNKRRSDTEMENDVRKCPKLEKASISINFNNSKISLSLENASASNNVYLKETHIVGHPNSSAESNKSIPSKAPFPNCSSGVKSNSLNLKIFTSKNTNIRNIFIAEKTQFICNILQNANKETMRKQVEKCHTDEDVELLLNELLEKEKLSSIDKLPNTSNLMSSRTTVEMHTSNPNSSRTTKASTSQTIPSRNTIPIVKNSNPSLMDIVHQAASPGPSILNNSAEIKYIKDSRKDESEDDLLLRFTINMQVEQLQEIFMDADPLYLLKWCSTIKGDQEKLQQLVDEMLVKRDYPKIKKENEIITEPDTIKQIVEKQHRIEQPPQPNLLLSNHSQNFRKRRVQNEPQNLENMKHIIFVDLDNWHNFFQKLIRPLPDLTFVWGFHGGASVWREPLRCENFTRWKFKKLFHLQQKCSNRKDAADFALVLKVGRMDERLPLEIAFTVLSGDAGFYEVELQMRDSERLVVVINPHHKAPAELQLLLESVGEV